MPLWFPWCHGPANDFKCAAVSDLVAEGQCPADARCRDTWHGPHPVEYRIVKSGLLRHVVVLRSWKRHLRCNDLARPEADVGVEQPLETADHQARADEEDQRERNLHDHAAAKEATASEAARRAARFVTQHALQFDPRRAQRG